MEESPVNAAISGIYSALSRNELVEASMLAEEVMGDIFRQWQKHKGDNEACELVAAHLCVCRGHDGNATPSGGIRRLP